LCASLLPSREKVALAQQGSDEGAYRQMAQDRKELMLERARQQRRNNVTAEAIVWRNLRARRHDGFKFRRQVPLEGFILDFICFEARCVIEIDGPSHDDEEQATRDNARDAWLKANEFRVLRLTNDLVIGAKDIALAQISIFLRG
jgi:very-short-patch-repair endonuclease